MASVTSSKYPLNPTLRWVTRDGRLTSEGFRIMRAVSAIVDSVTIEDGEVTTDKIAAGSITAEKITASKIDADEILQDGTLITDLIAANAVTSVGSAFSEDIEVDEDADEEVTVQTLAFTPTDGEVIISGMIDVGGVNSSGSNADYHFRLKRAGSEIIGYQRSVSDNGVIAFTLPFSYVDTSPGTSEVTWTITAECNQSDDYDINAVTLIAQNNKK